MCAKIAYGFWKKRSIARSVCSLSCGKSERKWHPHRYENVKTVQTIDNIATVAENVFKAPSTSIHRRSL